MSDFPSEDASGAGPVAKVDDVSEIIRVRIAVNGAAIEVTGEVKVREVLIKASNAGAIEGEAEEYVIERVEKEGELGLETTITVTEGERFLAVPTGSTTVAQRAGGLPPEK